MVGIPLILAVRYPVDRFIWHDTIMPIFCFIGLIAGRGMVIGLIAGRGIVTMVRVILMRGGASVRRVAPYVPPSIVECGMVFVLFEGGFGVFDGGFGDCVCYHM